MSSRKVSGTTWKISEFYDINHQEYFRLFRRRVVLISSILQCGTPFSSHRLARKVGKEEPKYIDETPSRPLSQQDEDHFYFVPRSCLCRGRWRSTYRED
ncbi:hypothetical protein AWC38_SpisGene13921 [Stylophora pistillata]|uniref:Uncharacterized protein n=1 Tax=Stylophora pistillata TaxID=50429 RepID=A0A2B4RZA5_STYPI|nr:hypothetical protein AWC38_SpisGene13921 [Stylophora pistillata]